MEQIDQIAGLVRKVLGGAAVGAYLHGSSVLGGLGPHSDVDVLVVCSRGATLEERRALISRLLAVSGPVDPAAGRRPVELSIVAASQVRPWRYPPPLDFQYGEWWRGEFERGAAAPWRTPEPDLALLITMTLTGNRPVFGPPPAQVLDAVPWADVIRSALDCIPGLLADLDGDTRNVILTLARVWTTLAGGVIRSKAAAADWALARLPAAHRPVLERARAVYLGERDESWDDLRSDIRLYADHVVGEVEALRRCGWAEPAGTLQRGGP